MKKSILIFALTLGVVQLCSAEVVFDKKIEVPASVKKSVVSLFEGNCPQIAKRETVVIQTMDYFQEQGISEYTFFAADRGYAANDPHWNFEIVVKSAQNQILDVQFKNQGDCW